MPIIFFIFLSSRHPAIKTGHNEEWDRRQSNHKIKVYKDHTFNKDQTTINSGVRLVFLL